LKPADPSRDERSGAQSSRDKAVKPSEDKAVKPGSNKAAPEPFPPLDEEDPES